jgi:hypothetical protein
MNITDEVSIASQDLDGQVTVARAAVRDCGNLFRRFEYTEGR